MTRVGDVYSIQTSKGDAYFQYMCKMPPMGTLIRVLPGTYKAQPASMESLVSQCTNFWIFFPIAAAEKQGIVVRRGRFPIPDHSRNPPLFRAGNRDPETGKVQDWWLWDGAKEWPIEQLTDEQRKLPIRGAWNDTLLIQRIEQGWLPEKDTR